MYMHSVWHEGASMDTLALMEIADHNTGEIIEQEQHDRPITFGLSLSMPLYGRWNVETGLQYSILKSRFSMGSEDFYIGKNQKIHYLGIPVRLSYRLADYKTLSVYGSGGLTLNVPVYGKTISKFVVDGAVLYTEKRHFTPSVQWTANISAGLQYWFLPNISIYVEPTLNWNIPNGSSTHTNWTENPIMFSVPFGIRITW